MKGPTPTRKTDQVRLFLLEHGLQPLYFTQATPTSAAAAEAVGCRVAEIAKSVLMLIDQRPVMVITSGDMRVKSSPLKRASGLRGRVQLPAPDQVEAFTGYPPGAVSPFLLPKELPVLLDVSLKRFTQVYPAAGNDRSAVAVDPDSLSALCHGRWAEVCDGADG